MRIEINSAHALRLIHKSGKMVLCNLWCWCHLKMALECCWSWATVKAEGNIMCWKLDMNQRGPCTEVGEAVEDQFWRFSLVSRDKMLYFFAVKQLVLLHVTWLWSVDCYKKYRKTALKTRVTCCWSGHGAVHGHAWSMLGCVRITPTEVQHCLSEQLL